jgi:hypothetical protein
MLMGSGANAGRYMREWIKKVSSMVLDIGSVVEFKPTDLFQVRLTSGDGEVGEVETIECYGWAVVVEHRDMRVVKTRVEPFGVCLTCSVTEPVVSHWDRAHGGALGYGRL